jgi:nucleotide-binding universal stress UspA family protein
MTQTSLPQRVFLATDMSARCDRALARAALLARDWESELTVAHVVHSAEVARRDGITGRVPAWRRPESWATTLERKLAAELEAEGIFARAKIFQSSEPDPVLRAAAHEDADLVVLGIAKDAPMDRIQLGSTVDSLVRRSRVPVLNVRNRASGTYRHVVVATDFSEPALQALRLAAHWFKDARLTLFHAYIPPGSSAVSGMVGVDSWRAVITEQFESHLADAALPPPVRAAMNFVLERGAPEALLADYVRSEGVDLVVLGSHGRGGVARALLGSTAENLLHTLDCDTLVVRRG